MFTGIVEELGVVTSTSEHAVRIDCRHVLADAHVGDSLSVNGCCLTIARLGSGWWEADVSKETRRRTTFDDLVLGDAVNLERSARLGDHIGGHIVQGHIDCVGTIMAAGPDLRVHLPSSLLPYCVTKGSIAVDGVSLTIVDVLDDGFTVALIPHTMSVTTLGQRAIGDRVNIEVDILAKHVERLLSFVATGAARS
jgi:riboflavin synthase